MLCEYALYGAISTHAPLARCDLNLSPVDANAFISTHAPLARCDNSIEIMVDYGIEFLLTHLLRGATDFPVTVADIFSISTHAPLARCDRKRWRSSHTGNDFYSRTSCEVRRIGHAIHRLSGDFYSRTSCEVRPYAINFPAVLFYFYSRTSCEVRLGFPISWTDIGE